MTPSTSRRGIHVFATTFNVGKVGDKLTNEDLQAWLAPAFGDGDHSPDLVAIGMQEVVELSAALTGLVGPALDDLNTRISHTLTTLCAATPSVSSTPSEYIPLRAVHHCNISLHLYYRETSLGGRIGKIATSSVGLGGLGKRHVGKVLRLGNKSAVGMRIPIKCQSGDQGEEVWETLTFINAHLAPHDENLELRNENYRSIVSSLLFTPSSVLDLPQHIYATSHCFFMGDLNYRLARLPPQGYELDTAYLPAASSGEERDPALVEERRVLLELDTLRQEQEKGKTMLGFEEGRLEAFAPSFKRVVGRVDGYAKKRVPGWADRIFWASARGGSEQGSGIGDVEQVDDGDEGKGAKGAQRTGILEYGSLQEVTVSDHKPVYAHFSLSAGSASALSSQATPMIHLPLGTFLQSPEDRNMIALRRLLGESLDRIIGFHWLLLLTPAQFAGYCRSHPMLLAALAIEVAAVFFVVMRVLML